MIDDDFERHAANVIDVTHHCRCGDAESDHHDDVFVSRRKDGVAGRACIIPFCRCPSFTPMTAWRLPERDEPPEAGP